MRISDWSSDVCSSDLQDGRELLERELKRLGLQQADPAPALQKFNAATLEDLQVMVALGDEGPHQVARALLEHERAANAPAATEGQELAVRRSEERRLGKGCVGTRSYRWSSSHSQPKYTTHTEQ